MKMQVLFLIIFKNLYTGYQQSDTVQTDLDSLIMLSQHLHEIIETTMINQVSF